MSAFVQTVYKWYKDYGFFHVNYSKIFDNYVFVTLCPKETC